MANNNQNSWKFGFGVSVLVASGLLGILAEIFVHRHFLDITYVSLVVHAWIEVAGAILGALIAILAWSIWKRCEEERPAECFLLASAFGSMGVFDIVHAFTLPGNLFVWLHTLAIFVGAIFFAAVLLPKNILKVKSAVSTIVVIIAALALGLAFMRYPDLAPLVFIENQIAAIAISINMAAGGLFLIAGAYFMVGQIEECRAEEMLIANFCMLSAAAAILFYVPQMWDAEWWLWHIIRFFGYAVTLFGLVVIKEKNSNTALIKKTI